MTMCACGHPHFHHKDGWECHTLTVTGPKTPLHFEGAAANMHMGRSVKYCSCRSMQPSDEQPGTGDQVQHQETKKEGK